MPQKLVQHSLGFSRETRMDSIMRSSKTIMFSTRTKNQHVSNLLEFERKKINDNEHLVLVQTNRSINNERDNLSKMLALRKIYQRHSFEKYDPVLHPQKRNRLCHLDARDLMKMWFKGKSVTIAKTDSEIQSQTDSRPVSSIFHRMRMMSGRSRKMSSVSGEGGAWGNLLTETIQEEPKDDVDSLVGGDSVHGDTEEVVYRLDDDRLHIVPKENETSNEINKHKEMPADCKNNTEKKEKSESDDKKDTELTRTITNLETDSHEVGNALNKADTSNERNEHEQKTKDHKKITGEKDKSEQGELYSQIKPSETDLGRNSENSSADNAILGTDLSFEDKERNVVHENGQLENRVGTGNVISGQNIQKPFPSDNLSENGMSDSTKASDNLMEDKNEKTQMQSNEETHENQVRSSTKADTQSGNHSTKVILNGTEKITGPKDFTDGNPSQMTNVSDSFSATRQEPDESSKTTVLTEKTIPEKNYLKENATTRNSAIFNDINKQQSKNPDMLGKAKTSGSLRSQKSFPQSNTFFEKSTLIGSEKSNSNKSLGENKSEPHDKKLETSKSTHILHSKNNAPRITSKPVDKTSVSEKLTAKPPKERLSTMSREKTNLSNTSGSINLSKSTSGNSFRKTDTGQHTQREIISTSGSNLAKLQTSSKPTSAALPSTAPSILKRSKAEKESWINVSKAPYDTRRSSSASTLKIDKTVIHNAATNNPTNWKGLIHKLRGHHTEAIIDDRVIAAKSTRRLKRREKTFVISRERTLFAGECKSTYQMRKFIEREVSDLMFSLSPKGRRQSQIELLKERESLRLPFVDPSKPTSAILRDFRKYRGISRTVTAP